MCGPKCRLAHGRHSRCEAVVRRVVMVMGMGVGREHLCLYLVMSSSK